MHMLEHVVSLEAHLVSQVWDKLGKLLIRRTAHSTDVSVHTGIASDLGFSV